MGICYISNNKKKNKINVDNKKEKIREEPTNIIDTIDDHEINMKKYDSVNVLEKKISEGTINSKRKSSYSLHRLKKKKLKETHDVKYEKSENGKKINNYTIEGDLGEGSFAKVKLASKKLLNMEKRYAIKIFKKSKLIRLRNMRRTKEGKFVVQNALQDVMKEIAIMKKLDHPNVIRLHEVLYGDEKNKLYLVLEFAEKGQLIEWNEDECKFFYVHNMESPFIPEQDLRKIFQDCLLGLYYLHFNGVIHRDIKPQNILFDSEGNAKLADFGVSELYESSDTLQTTEGTYYFMAPELFGNGVKTIKGKAADIWALGVTFFCFIFLEVPFLAENTIKISELIKNSVLKIPDTRNISKGLENLLRKMMEKDPEKRITLEELIKDEWITENGLDLVEIVKLMKEINIGEKDIDNIFIPLERVVFIKSVVKKLVDSVRFRSSSVKKIFSEEENAKIERHGTIDLGVNSLRSEKLLKMYPVLTNNSYEEIESSNNIPKRRISNFKLEALKMNNSKKF